MNNNRAKYDLAGLRRFVHDEGGNIAIVFGFTILVLMGCMGAAVDYGRWVAVRQQTQAAVDTAVLAASRVAQLTGDQTQAIAAANDYYSKMKSTKLINDGVMFVPGATINDWKVAGEAAVATPFLSFVGLSELPVKPRASASVALGGVGDSSLEISLMLDLTGSMCADGSGPCSSGPKIDALKKAAKDLIIEDGTRAFNFYDVHTGSIAQTSDGLRSAFRDIGLQLTKLRLTE